MSRRCACVWMSTTGSNLWEIVVMTNVINEREMRRTDSRQPGMSCELELHHKKETYFALAIGATLALTAQLRRRT